MTRKDFELIARVLRDHVEYHADDIPESAVLTRVAERFARELANTNPLFDRVRFLAACGVEEAS